MNPLQSSGIFQSCTNGASLGRDSLSHASVTRNSFQQLFYVVCAIKNTGLKGVPPSKDIVKSAYNVALESVSVGMDQIIATNTNNKAEPDKPSKRQFLEQLNTVQLLQECE